MTPHRKAAEEVFAIEAKAVADLAAALDEQFDRAVELILACKGKVVVSGIGKSGLIGRKICGTLTSTGTPSLFLHPVEAFHGDLGLLGAEDVFLALSYSGETEELLKLLPVVHAKRIPVIAMSGNPTSTLARHCTVHLSVAVHKEACPLELAPTSSTTATLVMGDALAVALMKARSFRPEDFAQHHPGGSLGRKLLTTVEQVMFKKDLPLVAPTDGLQELIYRMSAGRLGLAVVVDAGLIQGIVTDGDLRRAIDRHREAAFSLSAQDIMTAQPRCVPPDMKLAEAEDMMGRLKISSLLVADGQRLAGIVQLYSILP